jgi:hypothetical protein
VIALTAAKRRGLSQQLVNERQAQADATEQASLTERASLLASLRNCAETEAAALLSGSARDPQFEREIAAYSRRIVYHDFTRYMRPRLKALGKVAGEASPKGWRLRPR